MKKTKKSSQELLNAILFRCRRVSCWGSPLNPSELSQLDWLGTTAVVCATPDAHAAFVERMQTLREQGFERVVQLECRFDSVEIESFKSITAGWAGGQIVPPEPEGSVSPVNGLRARRTTESPEPIRYKVLDNRTVAEIRKYIDGDRRISRLLPPKILACSGQPVRLTDCEPRPFVLGTEDGQPELGMPWEGTTVYVRPLLDEDGRLQLEVRLTISEIDRIATVPFDARKRAVDGPSLMGDSAVELPTVTRVVIDGTVDIQSDQTLAIAGIRPTRTTDGNTLALVLFITPQKLFNQ